VVDEEVEETEETIGNGVTLLVEFWAFKYEVPPPRT